jgi:hypothetical protein
MTDDEIKEIKIRYNIADHEKYEGKKYRDTARYFMDLYTAERKATERLAFRLDQYGHCPLWLLMSKQGLPWCDSEYTREKRHCTGEDVECWLKWAREGNDDKQKLKVKLNMTGKEEPRIHYPEENDDK